MGFKPIENTPVKGFKPVEANKTLGTARAFTEGLTLGWSDEIGSWLAAAAVKAGGDEKPIGQIYSEMKAQYDKEQNQFSEENPKTDLTAQVVGGIGSGGVGAAKTAALQGGKRVLGMLGLGTAYGGLAGAGGADEGERTEGALRGAAIGGSLGVAVPFMGEGVGKVFQKIVDKTPLDHTDRKILEAIVNDQKTPQQVKDALIDFGEGGTIADVAGESTVNLLRASKGKVGTGQNVAENFLEGRVKGEYSRIMDKAKEIAGNKADFFQTLDDLKTARQTAAKPLYEQAYRVNIEVTPELQAILARPTMKTALKKAIRKAKDEGVTLDEKLIDTKRLDYTKRALDDMISKAPPGSDKQRVLVRMKNEMLDQIDPQNPQYAQARAVWSDNKTLEDALEKGSKFLSGDSDVLAREVASMSKSEREFFLLGAIRGMRNYIGKINDKNGIAQKFQNPVMRERLQTIFPDENDYNSFMKQLDKELRFTEVRNKVLSGSQTSEKMVADDALNKTGGALADIGRGDIARGGLGLLRDAAEWLGRPNPKMAGNVVNRLTDTDTANTLRYLSNLENRTGSIAPEYRKLLDAMTASGAIQVGL